MPYITYTPTHTAGKERPRPDPHKQQGSPHPDSSQAQDCCCCLVASVISDSEAQDYHPPTVAHYSFLQHINLKF